jgi:hypothetical protein
VRPDGALTADDAPHWAVGKSWLVLAWFTLSAMLLSAFVQT